MRPDEKFYARDCLTVAEELVGKWLCRRLPDGALLRLRITETEAYRGEEDTACPRAQGPHPPAEVLYGSPGTLYVYLCYGIHWLLNIVTGTAGYPQAVLIRACEHAEGPGRLTRALSIDGAFHGGSILSSDALWIEDDGTKPVVITARRVGIAYASEEDQARLWRFIFDAGYRTS
jgi:DNA-3-methyladenine glycosylase